MTLSRSKSGADVSSGDDKLIARLKTVAICLLIAQALALGLKGFEEYTKLSRLALDAHVQDTTATAERITGNIEEAATALRTGAGGGIGSLAIESLSPAIERAFRLSPPSNRARLADEAVRQRADELIRNDQIAGITDRHFVVAITSGRSVWSASASIANWVPQPEANQAFIVQSSDKKVGTGDSYLNSNLASLEPSTSRWNITPDIQRAYKACVPIEGTNMQLCAAKREPIASIADGLSLGTLALLFLGPFLAIHSLLRALKHRKHQVVVKTESSNELERRLELAVSAARCGLWDWVLETDKAFISAHFAKMLGLPAGGTVEGTEILNCIAPDDRDKVQRILYAAPNKGRFQITFRTVGPKPSWIEFRGQLSPDMTTARSTHIAGIAMDVTERKESEERIRNAERRLREAIEGFSGTFAVWDARKRLMFWNRAFETDFLLDREQLRKGLNHETISMHMSRVVRSERPSESDRDVREFELKDGRWIRLVERPTAEGGLISLGLDMTALKQHEEKLLRNEKKLKRLVLDLERSEGRAGELARKYGEEKARAEQASKTKGAFLANMSHELRTPLNAINGFSEILVKELFGPLGDPRYKDYAKDILLSGQHLLDMINDILDMAKVEAGKFTINPKPVDPIEPVDAAIRMIRRKAEDKGISLEFAYDEDVSEIEADHRAVKQMVLNLVSNAIKFTDNGGKISVSTRRKDNGVIVMVTDTGCGISEEDLPRLARPFEQVQNDHDKKNAGTGLGLALTKSFAEMHGGTFGIESEIGVGTTVWFTLPAIAATSEAAA